MNVEAIINRVIDREGGVYTDNPDDPGGPTKWGVTQATLSEWLGRPATTIDVANLSRADAYTILLDRFYLKPGFGRVGGLSKSIAEELTDTGVNCGQPVAITMLQRCLNAFNQGGTKYIDITVDGVIGSTTLRVLSEYLAWRRAEGEAVLVKALNCLQGDHYIELAEKNVNLETFTYGWLLNRVEIPA